MEQAAIFIEPRRGKSKIALDWTELLNLCVVDEIHTCKDDNSLRFALVSRLINKCKWRLGLTGTPFGRDPFAVWPQFFLLDGGETFTNNKHFFRAAFGKKQRIFY